jgi:hypothetical protein
MIFQPYVKNLRNVKGYAKKSEAAANVPKKGECIVKIKEYDFASVFIERGTLKTLLQEEAASLTGNSREYSLALGFDISPQLNQNSKNVEPHILLIIIRKNLK